MELTLEQYENIQKYIDGQMTPEDEKLFLEELSKSTVLQENLRFEQSIRQSLQSIHEDLSNEDFTIDERFIDAPRIKSLIETAGEEWKPKQQKIKLRRWLTIGIAASLLVGTIGITWFTSKTRPTPQTAKKNTDSPLIRKDTKSANQANDSIELPRTEPPMPEISLSVLYQRFFEKDNELPEAMPMMLADALSDYKDSNYIAIQNFDPAKIPDARGQDSTNVNSPQNIRELGRYYKGLSFIETGKFKEAMENLQLVTDSAQNQGLVAKAQWYRALLYIKRGNRNAAIKLLTSTSHSKVAPYNKRSQELLQLVRTSRK